MNCGHCGKYICSQEKMRIYFERVLEMHYHCCEKLPEELKKRFQS